jgi:hypothetical protein
LRRLSVSRACCCASCFGAAAFEFEAAGAFADDDLSAAANLVASARASLSSASVAAPRASSDAARASDARNASFAASRRARVEDASASLEGGRRRGGGGGATEASPSPAAARTRTALSLGARLLELRAASRHRLLHRLRQALDVARHVRPLLV